MAKDSDPASRRPALLLICAVAVATATNYTNHGPLLGFIRAEFGLSSADAGAIATAFFMGGASTMLAGGAPYPRSIFADRGRHLAQGLYGASFLLGSGIPLAYIPILAGQASDWRLPLPLSPPSPAP